MTFLVPTKAEEELVSQIAAAKDFKEARLEVWRTRIAEQGRELQRSEDTLRRWEKLGPLQVMEVMSEERADAAYSAEKESDARQRKEWDERDKRLVSPLLSPLAWAVFGFLLGAFMF